ncbi:MAG: MBL fold metallo-hydrolase [Dehalococcoidia bacterium]|jgi:ribonuclease Z|nr:MBL fold metallo-hydrolase [Dehalococcoidia bacterium]
MPDGSMEVTLLGTGSPGYEPNRYGNSTLVRCGDEYLLFDCGRATGIRMAGAGLTPGLVNKLFLTHLHSDHVVGIPDFYITGWHENVNPRVGPLRVWGPAGTTQMMGHIHQAFEIDEGIRAAGLGIPHNEYLSSEIEPGVVYEGSGLRVTAFHVDHRPVVPAFGFKIEYGGRCVVISGDTRPSEAVIEAATNADLLIHEVMVGNRETFPDPERFDHVMSVHTSPGQAGEIFKRARPGLAAYSHIVFFGDANVDDIERQTRETYTGPLHIGEDLTRIHIGDEITVESISSL